MLEIRGVYKTFNPGTINEKHALNGVDLTLNDGDFVTVIGGNGAGKSTMLNAVLHRRSACAGCLRACGAVCSVCFVTGEMTEESGIQVSERRKNLLGYFK